MSFRVAAAIALALSTASARPDPARAAIAAAASARGAEGWIIGPVVRGRNYSRRMPLHPTPGRNGAFSIELPRAPGSVHYVTFRHGSLQGKRRIVMRYRIEAEPGARIVPRTMPTLPSMITLYFQRSGDNWTARGPFETYRWYATFATRSPVTPGTHVMVAPLDANWTAVQGSTARTQPAAFRAAKAQADEVGFVLGGGDGAGHGVYATGRARLIVTEFQVE